MVIPYESVMPKSGIRTYGGVPVTGSWVEKGKRYILVYKGKTYKVARLVCEAFNGPPTHLKNVCMHIDENGKNNNPKNLAWGTQKENLNAPKFIEYCKKRTKEDLARRSPYT
jgi:hypothetical protein